MLNELKYLSIVSGTSTDGLSLSVVELDGCGRQTSYRVIETVTVPYEKEFSRKLLTIASNEEVSAEFVSSVHWELGRIIRDGARNVKGDYDIISFSGHTVYHGPSNGDVMKGTYQIGEISVLAAETGKTAVCDFRVSDVAQGGLGAPLTALADYFIFHEPGTVALNIGGISNITCIQEDGFTAFDTGPGNMLIDAACRLFFDQEMDIDGKHARQGRVDNEMLRYLMKDPYLLLEPPKNSGREYYSREYLERVRSEFGHLSGEDFIRTITRFTSECIRDQITKFANSEVTEIVAGGGGTRNPVIMKDLEEMFPGKISSFSEHGIDEMARECLGFAVLANQLLHLKPGRLTDTRKMVGPVLGRIIPGNNFRKIMESLFSSPC